LKPGPNLNGFIFNLPRGVIGQRRVGALQVSVEIVRPLPYEQLTPYRVCHLADSDIEGSLRTDIFNC